MSEQRTIDLYPLVKDLMIVTKGSQLARLGDVMVWPQRLLIDWMSQNLNSRKPTRAIILKARQLGISTLIKAVDFAFAMWCDYYKSQTISHMRKSTEHLVSMSQVFFDHYQFRQFYRQTNAAAGKLGWDPVKSQIGVNTANTLQGLRSLTFQFGHCSEVAFWPNASTLMASVGPALPEEPFSFLFLESTANGIGNWFSETWDEAVAGENDYVPFFFPWQTHPQYTGDYIGLDPVDARSLDDMEAQLADEFAADRLGEENLAILSRTMTPEQLREISGPMSRDEILSRLAWRRRIIRTNLRDPDLFLQEYPHRPSVAFLSTGRNIFPLTFLDAVYVPATCLRGDLLSQGGKLRFVDNPFGGLKVYRPPQPDRHYLVAGDPTFTTGGDYACAQIIDRQTWEQVAVFRKKVDPSRFGEELVRLGYWYNTALLAPESNKDGATTVGRILGLDYPNVWQRQVVDTMGQGSTNKAGWFTNERTKHEKIGNLQACVYDGSLVIHDEVTYAEMKNYVDLGAGSYGNANGQKNDDTVSALAIAVTVNQYEAWEMPPDGRDLASMEEQQMAMLARVHDMLQDESKVSYDQGYGSGDDW